MTRNRALSAPPNHNASAIIKAPISNTPARFEGRCDSQGSAERLDANRSIKQTAGTRTALNVSQSNLSNARYTWRAVERRRHLQLNKAYVGDGRVTVNLLHFTQMSLLHRNL